jgi:hypothetical protein
MNKNNSRQLIIHERPEIIMIPSVSPTSRNEYNEYSLKENFFDPSKSSPPNEFLLKLQLRMNSYSKSLSKDDMRNSE